MFPTNRTLSRSMPSCARFSSASGLCVNSRSDNRSVSTRFISSGMLQSPDRRPDSRCTTGIWSLHAASAHATVELTSPAHDHEFGSVSYEDLLERNQYLAGLLPVRARSNPE